MGIYLNNGDDAPDWGFTLNINYHLHRLFNDLSFLSDGDAFISALYVDIRHRGSFFSIEK